MSHLPSLRQELSLTPGAATPDGAPTWMLHDPAGNRFFQIGWPAFEMLSRWSLDDPEAIVASVNAQTTLRLTRDDFEALLRMLHYQHLLVAASPADTGLLENAAAAHKLSRAMWLLKHYLMIRVPLWHPMPFLRRFARYAEIAYRPAFWMVIVLMALSGLVLVSQRWDEFIHTFHGYADVRGLVAIGAAIACAKILHEFGHAFTAHRYGCRVPTMGVALLVMVPVLYTDTTEAWKVPGRAQRLRIGAAGMLTELALAAVATLAWSVLPDGPLRAGAFLLATTTWIGTLTINASPFMRFDGYFLLSDWLDMPNLHDRAFALGRWWLRERLFGFGDPQPEPCAVKRRRFLIAFSFVTWLYRLVVFFSIALVVYHTFFKALGLMLFFVEFGWFIARPVAREITACWQRRAQLHWRRETRRTAIVGTLLLGFFVLPWHGGVSAPAVLGPLRAQGLYAPEAGYVTEQAPIVHDGQRVRAGDVLAVLASPDLTHRLQAAQADETLLGWQVAQQSFDNRLLEQGVALRRRWEAARQTVTGLAAQVAQLTLRAPFDGVVQTDDALAPGTWLPRGEHVFDVVGPIGVKGEAFVGEGDAARIAAGDRVDFVASVPELGAVHCRVTAVDRVNAATLDVPSLASVYGGPLPVQQKPDTHQLVPLAAIYRVRIGECPANEAWPREIDGTATIGGARQSFAWRGLKYLASVFWREGGA
ncbi:MAG: HlyD family efflux transporter periplasmic adaptor subunit [Burkholderiales bacterium]|nr:HlyD family efflux transporter periplasmic adaptor subunit [Burkholderiales bacterium]